MEENTNAMHGISLAVECEVCKAKFSISSGDGGILQHKKEYNVNGRSIFLTYYDCPSCGRRHFVQIDDVYTLELLESNKKTFVKLAAKRSNDKPVQKSQLNKYKRQIQQLHERRLGLMKEFSGTILYEGNVDNGFELRFSV